MQGYNVLIQWDLIHLDYLLNNLIQTGHHPAEFTKKNIDVFRKQIKSLDFLMIGIVKLQTSDPEYYKWTLMDLYKII